MKQLLKNDLCLKEGIFQHKFQHWFLNCGKIRSYFDNLLELLWNKMSHQNKTSVRESNQKIKKNNFICQQIGSSIICDNRRDQNLSFIKIWRKMWVKSNTLLLNVETLFISCWRSYINEENDWASSLAAKFSIRLM